MKKPILVQTTFENQQDAGNLAEALLTKKLVACAQVSGPVKSMYWWDDKIEHSPEYRLTLKTFDNLFPEIEEIVIREHPYDVPEIIAVAISHVSDSYKSWMEEEIDHD